MTERHLYDLIVRISVPVLGGEYEIGTGYPVGTDLILTSRHVVQPEKRDSSRLIKVFWQCGHDRAEPEAVDLDPQVIVWLGTDSIDAALVRCPRPEGADRGWGFFANDHVPIGAAWSGAGFATAAKVDEVRRREPFAGTVVGPGDPRDMSLVLSATTYPKATDGWSGASGMPVFVDSRIVGVLKGGLREFHPSALHITPAKDMLANSEFRALIGYDDIDPDEEARRRQGFRSKLTDIISRTPRPFVDVAKQLGLQLTMTIASDHAEFAGRILDMRLEQAVDILREVRQSVLQALRDQPEQARIEADALSEAVQLIVPALYKHAVVWKVRRKKGEVEAGLIEVNAHHSTVAEILMAGADGRQTEFQPRQNINQFPEGRLSLPQAPEGGFDKDGETAAANLLKHLHWKFQPGEPTDLCDAADKFMIWRFYTQKQTGAKGWTREEERILAKKSLVSQTSQLKKTFYLLFRPPDDAAERQKIESQVRDVCKYYPGLVCLAMSEDFDIAQEEYDHLLAFCPMLPVAEELP